jgi:hypothetical protein
MNRRIVLPAAAIFGLALPALSSAPGQRMDCSDITLADPGLSCAVAVSQLPPLELAGPGIGPIQPFFLDNEGNIYMVQRGGLSACPGWNYYPRLRWEIRRLNADGTYAVVVASESRCAPDGTMDYTESFSFPAFDAVNGRVLIPIRSSCIAQSALCTNYLPQVWFAAIDGFPTLSDVLSRKKPEHDNDRN